MYEMQINDLKKKLQVAEECAQDSHSLEIIRQLEHQKEAAVVEVKTLQEELRVSLCRALHFQEVRL